MVYNIEWENTNQLRGHPFVAETKLLPIVDFYMVIPSGTQVVHISEVNADGIIISVDNVRYGKSPVAHYTSIISRPNFIYKITNGDNILPDPIGYLVADGEMAFPQEFSQTSTEIIPTLCIHENPGGLKRIFIRNVDGTLVKLKQNIVFEAGRNMVIDTIDNRVRFSNITVPDFSGYVRGLEIDGKIASDDSITIFGRNIVKVRGVDFSTIIENADANCPTRFPDALRGGEGGPGGPGDPGPPGDPGLIVCGGCGCFDCPCCGEEDLIFCCGEEDLCLEYDLDCCIPFTDIDDLCCCPNTEQCCIEGDFCPEGDFVNTSGGAGPPLPGVAGCFQLDTCVACDQGDGPAPPPAGAPCPIDIPGLNNFNQDLVLTSAITSSQSALRNLTFGSAKRINVDTHGGEYAMNVAVQSSGTKIEEDNQLIVRLTLQIMPIGGNPLFDADPIDLYFLDAVVPSNTSLNYKLHILKPGPNTDKDDLFTYMVDEDCKNCLIYDTWTTPTAFTSTPITKQAFLLYENGDKFEIVNTRYAGWHQDGNNSQDVLPFLRPTMQVFDQDLAKKTNAIQISMFTAISSASIDTFHIEKAATFANGAAAGGIGEWGLTAGSYGISGATTRPTEDISDHRLCFLGGWFNDVDTDNSTCSLWQISAATGSLWSEIKPDTQSVEFTPTATLEDPSVLSFPNMNYYEGVYFIKTRENLIATTLTIDRVHKIEPEKIFNSPFPVTNPTTYDKVPVVYVKDMTDFVLAAGTNFRRYRLRTTQAFANTIIDQASSKFGYFHNTSCTIADRKMATVVGSTEGFTISTPAGGPGITDINMFFPLPDNATGRKVSDAFVLDVPLVGNHGLVYGPDSDLVGDTQIDAFLQFSDVNFRSQAYTTLSVFGQTNYTRWDWNPVNVPTRATFVLDINTVTGTSHKGLDENNTHKVFLSLQDPTLISGISSVDVALPGTLEFDNTANTTVINSGTNQLGFKSTIGDFIAATIFPYSVFANDVVYHSKLQEFISGTLTRERLISAPAGSGINVGAALKLSPITMTLTTTIPSGGNDFNSTLNQVVAGQFEYGQFDADTPVAGNPNVIYNIDDDALSTHQLRLVDGTAAFYRKATALTSGIYVRDPSGVWNITATGAPDPTKFPPSVTIAIP